MLRGIQMNVAVMYGGKTGEHEVSLKSASSIVRHIHNEHTIILIGIAKDARWFLQPATEVNRIRKDENSFLTIDTSCPQISIQPGSGKKSFIENGEPLHIDVVFPVLHGTYGEDGTIQGLFEMAEIPYVGAHVMASSLSMDKEKTKQVWLQEGLPTLPYVCIKKHHRSTDIFNTLVKKAEDELNYPLFVKPCNAGSSIGTAKAENCEELIKKIDEAFEWDQKILIEPFVPAREIECSVMGNAQPTAYTLGEIIPSHEFYDYEAKYTDPDGARLQIPAKIDEEITSTIQSTAIKAYQALDLCGLSRVDFFIDKRNGNLYLNEVNTMPGFTSISMFPKMCEASGLAYPALIQTLLSLAIEQWEQCRSLKTSKA